jgi:uncharacterized membrane protein
MAASNALPIGLALLCVVPFFTALIVSAITAYLVSQRLAAQASAAAPALEILKERYARGELTREQYEEMRRVLEQ